MVVGLNNNHHDGRCSGATTTMVGKYCHNITTTTTVINQKIQRALFSKRRRRSFFVQLSYVAVATFAFLLFTTVVGTMTMFFLLPAEDDVILAHNRLAVTLLPKEIPEAAPVSRPSAQLRRTTTDGKRQKDEDADVQEELLNDHFRVSTLQAPIDYEQYTVRINTWQRLEQLAVSIAHHKSCPAVASIQVVWCTDQGDVPAWLDHDPIVTVERHDVNSLNERFHVLVEPLTAAVLSIDDDVLRPCLAFESGFHKWTMNPDRQVGFDARSHDISSSATTTSNNNNNNIRWRYAYMSTTEKSNKYSITLTRCSFLHRDYLRWYMTVMPKTMREYVATNFNCEDIAMSLAISSLTDGRPPLLADYWAVKSQIKLYVDAKISGGTDHKQLRDECMDSFATALRLKDRLHAAQLQRGDAFEYGATADNWNRVNAHDEPATIQRWKKQGFAIMRKELDELRVVTSHLAYDRGLLEGSPPWKRRYAKHGHNG